MADKPTKKPMGLLKKTVLTGAIAGGVGLGIGLKNEADIKSAIEEANANGSAPSEEVCATDIANAERRTSDLAAGGAVFGAALALANAAAKKANENRANQPKKGRTLHLADPEHPDHQRVKLHGEFIRQDEARNRER
jgi:hypothetical protein